MEHSTATASTHLTRVPLGPLRITPLERVTSLLLALLALAGIVVFCLLVAWWGSQVFARPKAVPVILADLSGGSSMGTVGDNREIAGLDPEQVAEETDLAEKEIGETVATVLDAAGRFEASLGAVETSDSPGARPSGRQQGTGDAAALGSGEGPGGIPRAQRWAIHFAQGATLDEYARQLDFFGIELGLLGLGDQVQYVSRFSDAAPRVRAASRADEGRLYMSWIRGERQQADHELVRRANLDTFGKTLVQFYPAAVENMLAELEASAGRKPEHIQRTRFGVRKTAGGYAFHVIDQTPLTGR